MGRLEVQVERRVRAAVGTQREIRRADVVARVRDTRERVADIGEACNYREERGELVTHSADRQQLIRIAYVTRVFHMNQNTESYK